MTYLNTETETQFNEVFETPDPYEWDSEVSVLEYQLKDMRYMPREKRVQHRERLSQIREMINDLIEV